MFFADGKPWRACLPGADKVAHEIMRQVGNENVNFSQMAHCNGHHAMHGFKVSSFLQADGVRHAQSESVCGHDHVALHRSTMIEMICQLRIGPDLRVPKCSSDKACGGNEVNQPQCTEEELANLTSENRELVEEENHKNRMPRCAIED